MWMKTALFLLFLTVSSTVFAAPGDLDRTFNPPSGLVFYDPGESGNAVAVQEDGKIVVAGTVKNNAQLDVLLLRYNPDGLLDTTFGTNGVVVYGTPAGDESATGVLIDSQGRILVTGGAFNGSDNDVLVLRYGPDGQLDTTFGTNGVFIYNSPANDDDFGRMAALQPESEKIIMVGGTFNGANTDVLIFTLNPDGSPDSLFGTNGAVIFNGPGNGDDVGEAVAIQPDGRIILTGGTFNGPNSEILLIRLNSDGAFDPNFAGGDGIATYGAAGTNVAAKTLALQDDGRIVVAGGIVIGASLDLLVMRFNANGTIDQTFGPVGVLLYGEPTENESAKAMALQPDGRIIVAGIANNGSNDDGLLLRYTPAGQLDAQFGVDGALLFNTYTNGIESFNGVAVQPDGKVLVAGRASPGTLDYDVVILRLIGQESMEVPNAQQSFSYSPAIDPAMAVDPKRARPLGVGPVVAGGGVVNLRAAFPQFSGPVDIYLGFYAPSVAAEVWLIGAGNTLQRLTDGLVNWKENIVGPVAESLFGSIQVSGLPPGPYHFYQMVTQPGDMGRFYFWATELSVP
jgi:uncharacterized delta-60 repeat protein